MQAFVSLKIFPFNFPSTTTIWVCIHNDLLFFNAFAFSWPIFHLLTMPCSFNGTPLIWRSILLLTNWKNMLDGRFGGNPGHPQSKINPSPPAQMHLTQIIVLLLVWKYLDWWLFTTLLADDVQKSCWVCGHSHGEKFLAESINASPARLLSLPFLHLAILNYINSSEGLL